jgi:hypothetical protein
VVLYEIYIKYLGAEILLTMSVVKVASADAQPHRSIIHANPHFIKHFRKGNKLAFCEFCRTATECTILRPSEKKIIFSWFHHTIFKVLTTQV